jgi:hypothetical protein
LKVFDCFTFFEERELLLARLRLLADHVDHFVVVEGTRTFRGDVRTPVLLTMAQELEFLGDRLIRVEVSDFPETRDPWVRERFQRDAIMRGLGSAEADDLVLISDVDEIPKPAIVDRLKRQLADPVALSMRFSYYKLNLSSAEPWSLARATRFADLHSPQALRERSDLSEVPDAGWHLSYIGSTDDIVRKLTSFSHSEYSTEVWTSQRHIERCIRLGVRLFGSGRFIVVPDEECIPTLPRSTHPELFHPGRSWIVRVWARVYEIIAAHRERLPIRLTDHAPLLVAIPAVLLHVRLKATIVWTLRRQSSSCSGASAT